MRFPENNACNQYLTFYCDGVEAISPAKTNTHMKNETPELIAYRDQRDLRTAQKAIYGLVKNIETVRWLAKHDIEALRGLGCLQIGSIPDDVSLESDAWKSIVAFRNAIQ
jgi:hypothetical protein